MKEPENCLGISLGMQRMGIAIGTSRELIESQVKYFDKQSKEGKTTRICKVVERVVLRYQIARIAIKVPRTSSRTNAINGSIEALSNLAMSIKIPVVLYEITALENRFVTSATKNKEKLALDVVNIFPELNRYYAKIGTDKGLHYHKLFEAVAAMKLLSESVDGFADPL